MADISKVWGFFLKVSQMEVDIITQKERDKHLDIAVHFSIIRG